MPFLWQYVKKSALKRQVRPPQSLDKTLGESVHVGLRERLIGGEVSPGEKLSLRAVAESLGVSMTPVRHAVSRLVAENALEVLPKSAVRVPFVTLQGFRELTAVRLAIEGMAAEAAARSRTKTDIARISAADAAFRRQQRAARPDLGLAVRTNKDFHFAIYRAAAMPTLVRIIEGLWLRVGPIINLDLRSSAMRLRAHVAEQHHAAALAAIEQQDEDAARAAITADIAGTARYLEQQNWLAADA